MIGTLAVACFVKTLGSVYLGIPRSDTNNHAKDPSISMIIPMVATALGCLGIGLFPLAAVRGLDDAARTWASLPEQNISITDSIPLAWITTMGLALILFVGIIILALKIRIPSRIISRRETWDCGYAQPTARIQYTGSSLGQTLVTLFACILWPKTHRPSIRGFFRKTEYFKTIVPDTVLDRLVLPLFHTAGRYLPSLRIFQQGQTHFYVLYILIIVIILLICGTIGVQS